MSSSLERRPTYVLGAGFSKAISNSMPVTNELGVTLAERLVAAVGLALRPGETFEEWLTLQVTPLPFLEGFENSRRVADAARVIAEIAHVLDENVAAASESSAPLWLRQLIALWHAERAVVLTFNYDTLIERAVNGSPPTTMSRDGHVGFVLGDHVVFPAPPAPQAQFIGDSGIGHTSDSFEILKMHGSLTWYWASGDTTGSTLIRVREKHVFGSAEPLSAEADFSGATTLDRYLIPPVTAKDSYYGSYLANTLWRMARSHIASASSLTLIGYSLPPEDKVASQLIAQVSSEAAVSVVDRDPGMSSPASSVLGNLARLGINAVASAAGPDCVADYVAGKLQSTTADLPRAAAFDELENPNSDVVVAISKGWGTHDSGGLFVLSWSEDEQHFEAHEVSYNYLRGSTMPYRESILNAMPKGHRRLEDFVTAARLRALIDGGKPFTFQHPHTREAVVGVGAERRQVERWELLELKWAPFS